MDDNVKKVIPPMRKGMDEREGSKIGGILDVVYGRPLSLSFSYLLHAAHKRMRTVTNYFLVILNLIMCASA